MSARTTSCAAGYSGFNCDGNVNECSSSPCQHGGQCNDGVNGYSCECDGTGYDGNNCADDVDECASTPCDHGSVCLESTTDASIAVGVYSCTCVAGYSGVNCDENINECLSSPCLNGGQCNDGVDSYACVCAGGWQGGHCETNPCTGVDCGAHGTCGQGVCTCRDGWWASNVITRLPRYCSSLCVHANACVAACDGEFVSRIGTAAHTCMSLRH